jgi:hypothetical protein
MEGKLKEELKDIRRVRITEDDIELANDKESIFFKPHIKLTKLKENEYRLHPYYDFDLPESKRIFGRGETIDIILERPADCKIDKIDNFIVSIICKRKVYFSPYEQWKSEHGLHVLKKVV